VENEFLSTPSDIWGLTTYFNPCHYKRKLANLKMFADRVRRQDLSLFIVELAFGEDAHVLDTGLCDSLLQVRSKAVMWQKERLLNIALGHLDADCSKVVWLDGDILFENPEWVQETARLLDTYPVVQPFHIAHLLPKDEGSAVEGPKYGPREGEWMYGMAYAMSRVIDHQGALKNYADHGHCGLAWAARRELLDRHGFYDHRIDGGGDLTMAHAMFGNIENWRHTHWERDLLSPTLLDDIVRWGRTFSDDVRSRVGYVPGRVLHLWHGNHADRMYKERANWLAEHDFDPDTDIALADSGCWEWASRKPELHRKLQEYYSLQREDD
jgi:hypothetical protein